MMHRYVFNPKLESPLRFVHPLQVKSVSCFLSTPFPEYVDYVIMFGGSLDLACGIDSDIDFYVISDHDSEAVYKEIYERCKNLGRPFDIIVSPLNDFITESAQLGTVEHRISREGLCLYAKAQNKFTGTS